MKNQNKIFGAIFVAIGLVNLIRLEWIDFGIFAAIGGKNEGVVQKNLIADG